jgi:hypothetical protein
MNFLNKFSKNAKISNLMKIRPVGAGRTDVWIVMTKPIVASRNFAHVPNNNIFKSRFNGRISAISDENVGSVSKNIYVYHLQEWTRIKQGMRRDIM